MAKIEITVPGERIVEEFTALVPQPTTPGTARPPDIGLVEISQSTPTQLIPGPPGAQGPRGSRWFTGSGPPASTSGFLLGDQYLDGVTGIVWTFDGTAWVQTSTDLTGPQGGPDTPAQVLAKLITVDGSGSNLDADLLDGQNGVYYLDWANFTGKPVSFPPTLPIAQSGVTNLVSDLAAKAPLASPVLTGNPTAPTQTAGDNDTSIATTAFVQAALPTWGTLSGKPATFPPTLPIAESDVTNLVTDLAAKAPLASPVFTGDPKAPTPTAGDNDTSIATTAFVATAVAAGVGKAPTYQRITTSGTYTPPVGLIRAKVKVVAGGGGGHYARVAASQGGAGSGGGAGGEAEAVLTAAQIGASQTITIGSGGAGGNGATPTAPGGGGTTSFGALVVASGGAAGINIPTQVGPVMTRGGTGGVGSTGTVLRGGGHGHPAFVIAGNTANAVIGSNGGNGTEGRGGLGGMDTVDGLAGEFGGGGGGTSVSRGNTPTNGGAGGAGLILIEEWYF